MRLQHFEDSYASIDTNRSISAQALATWLLSSLMILCIVLRVLHSFKIRSRDNIKFVDDVQFTFVGLIALGSILSMPTVVTGIATNNTVPLSDVAVKSYVSTILLVFTLGFSKMPILFWLRRLELARVYRTCTVTIGCITLAHMVATIISLVLQCGPVNFWDVQAVRCISMRSFWTSIIVIDITIDMVLIILPIIAITNQDFQPGSKSRPSLLLSLRTLLIAASLVRLVYLQQPFLDEQIPALGNLPYAIATQCHVATAAILACVPALPCLASLVKTSSNDTEVTLNKHWSGSSFGSDIATDYFASVPSTPIKEPLSAIQASMGVHRSPIHSSHHSSVASLPSKFGAKPAPPRPQSPSANERPDMKMFIQRPKVMRPPPVTLIRDVNGSGSDCDAEVAVRTSKHVKFVL